MNSIHNGVMALPYYTLNLSNKKVSINLSKYKFLFERLLQIYLFEITIRNRKLFLRMCHQNLIYIYQA